MNRLIGPGHRETIAEAFTAWTHAGYGDLGIARADLATLALFEALS